MNHIDIPDKVVAVRFGNETQRELENRAAQLNYELRVADTVPRAHKGRTA